MHEGRFGEAAGLYAGDYVEPGANNHDIDREFTYTVVRGEDGYVVLELPPYVP